MIRKVVSFIWNDNNAKERSFTYLVVKCSLPELCFDEVWSLPNYFVMDDMLLLCIEGLKIFDPKI